MPAAFAISALAVAAERANAVGAVRLTCDGDCLEIELTRVAPHQSGFAPAAVVEEVAFRVPYRAVRAMVRQDRMLVLAIDPAAASYNRFALVRFTDDPPETLLVTHSARLRASMASWLAPLPLGLVVAAMLPGAWIGGPLGFAAVTAVVAVITWRVLRELHSWLSWGGPVSDAYRSAFESRIGSNSGSRRWSSSACRCACRSLEDALRIIGSSNALAAPRAVAAQRSAAEHAAAAARHAAAAAEHAAAAAPAARWQVRSLRSGPTFRRDTRRPRARRRPPHPGSALARRAMPRSVSRPRAPPRPASRRASRRRAWPRTARRRAAPCPCSGRCCRCRRSRRRTPASRTAIGACAPCWPSPR
ncbi:MAG: hypothetical protein WKG00_11555 [Polyangiaceae bacterium]